MLTAKKIVLSLAAALAIGVLSTPSFADPAPKTSSPSTTSLPTENIGFVFGGVVWVYSK